MIKTKVSTAITVDISAAKATLTVAKQFGNTIRYDGETGEALKTAPIVNPEVIMWNAQRNESEVSVKARIEGQTPLAPFPILDPISSLIDQPIVWKGKTSIDNHISDGYINVSYSLIGKGFPAFESFIEDAKGTKLFIGAYTSPAKSKILLALSGSELSLSRTFNTKISTDQDGNFNGVYTKDRNGNDVVVSPATYNAQISNASPARDLPGKKFLSMKISLWVIVVGLSFMLMSCDHTLHCEKHFIPSGYVGKVTVYFNQKNGQKQYDKDGCIVYSIPKDGKCLSALPIKQGTAYPNQTFTFYELVSKDSTNQIFEFYENDYLKDTIHNREKKYIFLLSSGYSEGNYNFEYYVDYGKAYKSHLHY